MGRRSEEAYRSVGCADSAHRLGAIGGGPGSARPARCGITDRWGRRFLRAARHTQRCRAVPSAAFFRQKWQRLQVSIDFLKFYGILMVYKTIFRFPQQWAAVFVVPFTGLFLV